MKHPMKKIVLTVEVEWAGSCPEDLWGEILTRAIEKDGDEDTHCRVTKVEKLTDFGTTSILSESDLRESLGWEF